MQKWKVCLRFESEGNILMESKLYILEENEMKNRLEGNPKGAAAPDRRCCATLEVRVRP